jgi:hypothetical protein
MVNGQLHGERAVDEGLAQARTRPHWKLLRVIAGLDPAIHPHLHQMDHRVSALRTGPVMTLFNLCLAIPIGEKAQVLRNFCTHSL